MFGDGIFPMLFCSALSDDLLDVRVSLISSSFVSNVFLFSSGSNRTTLLATIVKDFLDVASIQLRVQSALLSQQVCILDFRFAKSPSHEKAMISQADMHDKSSC